MLATASPRRRTGNAVNRHGARQGGPKTLIRPCTGGQITESAHAGKRGDKSVKLRLTAREEPVWLRFRIEASSAWGCGEFIRPRRSASRFAESATNQRVVDAIQRMREWKARGASQCEPLLELEGKIEGRNEEGLEVAA